MVELQDNEIELEYTTICEIQNAILHYIRHLQELKHSHSVNSYSILDDALEKLDRFIENNNIKSNIKLTLTAILEE